MSRKRLRIVPSASVFPFLSVLACVVGMLAFMIGMLAPTQAEGRKVELSAEDVKKFEELQEQIAFADIDVRRLIQRRDEAEDVHTRLEKSDAELQRARDEDREQQERTRAADEQKSRLQSESDTLARESTKLEKDAEKLKAEVADLQTRLADLNKPAPEPVNIVNKYGLNRGIEPVFIECRKEGLVLMETDEPVVVPANGLRANRDYLGLLERVVEVPGGGVVFLIREDGVETFLTARIVARQKSCKYGKLPIVGHGPIELGLVKTQIEKSIEE